MIGGPADLDADLRAALIGAARNTPILVASDYDGTLAPIVEDPAAAQPLASALAALVGLADLPGVHAVIVSGRTTETLAAFTGAPARVELIGNHGADHDRPGRVDARRVEALHEALRDVADTYQGVLVEPKPVGAAVHYRRAVDPTSAAVAARKVARRFDARIVEGKEVVELLLAGGDKGTAIAAVRRRTAAATVVFFGDDTTDEDVFATLGPGDVGIKVGAGATLAHHRVPDPAGVAAALELLAVNLDAAPDDPQDTNAG